MTTKQIMMTVDIEGDWGGHTTRAIGEVLPPLLQLFDKYHVCATFFVVGNLVSLVKGLLPVDGRHEIGSHGLSHTVLTSLSDQQIFFEIEESKRLIENAGYTVTGFRAPYLKSPKALPQFLSKAGYCYDASGGSVYPCLFGKQRANKQWQHYNTMKRLATSTLRDGITPFSLTYLRLYHPFGLQLISPKATMFYFHLHELLDHSSGWDVLPLLLRKIHQRNSGHTAWKILEKLLQDWKGEFVTCDSYMKSHE